MLKVLNKACNLNTVHVIVNLLVLVSKVLNSLSTYKVLPNERFANNSLQHVGVRKVNMM